MSGLPPPFQAGADRTAAGALAGLGNDTFRRFLARFLMEHSGVECQSCRDHVIHGARVLDAL